MGELIRGQGGEDMTEGREIEEEIKREKEGEEVKEGIGRDRQ